LKAKYNLMRSSLLLIIALFWMIIPIFSQVVINDSDMPVPGDTIRVSMTGVVPSGYEKTGMDTAWNYAMLEALTQRVDTFASATSTPAIYQLIFVLLGGANLASPVNIPPIPGLPVTDGFTFFKNSTGSFSNLGSAVTIQGLPLPAKYDVPDKQYQFPMTPGLTWSSVSSFAINIPNVLSYSTQRIRSSTVDGWGDLTTPYGTFQTLRVKSTLAIHDSIYIDTLGFGLPMNRDIIEYKWLAKGKGIPLLQINQENNSVAATYRDFYRMSAEPLTVNLGPDTTVARGTILTLKATVTGGTPPYQIFWSTLDSGSTITDTIMEPITYTAFAMDAMQAFGTGQRIVSIDSSQGYKEAGAFQLSVFPNPSSGKVRFTLNETCNNAFLQVITSRGKIIRQQSVYPLARIINADFTDLPDGLYFIHISAAGKSYNAKLQVIR
jgi:hypothetical protein